MNASETVRLYRELDQLGIRVWLDGGWGVDALLGYESRAHDDVDLVVQQADLSRLRDYLESRGYSDVPRDDTRPWNFVMARPTGEEVDIHVVVFDDAGNGVYGPPERGVSYPASAFGVIGTVADQPVRCLTAEYQLESHHGYELREKDHADIAALRRLV
jgi:lincosamide nucleotidyltransferase A/C/D/E